MSKLSLEFKRDVLKKLKEANLTLMKKPNGMVDPGWEKMPHLGDGSIEQVELRPEFKKLLNNCDVSVQFCSDDNPVFARNGWTGEERIMIPWPQQFENEEGFYRVLLHELGHWTGTKKRLNREMGRLDCCKYHSALGAVEEITVELASVMLAEHFGFVPNYVRAADYINGYLNHVVKNAPEDKDELLKLATAQAVEVVDHIASLT